MVDSVYKIPIDSDDALYIEFFKEFERRYPKFKIIKHYVKKIVVQQIEQMQKQDVSMLYYKNQIYISPTLRNVDYLEEGFLHEIGHIILSRSDIKENDEVKDEFFVKRKMVLQSLMQDYKVPQRIQDLIKNLEEFSTELDDFLNKTVGYEKLGEHINGYFLDPYGMSSFDEYLATGFEMYFSEYKNALKGANPILYREIDKLISKF